MMNQNRALFCSSTFDGFYELFLAAVFVSLFFEISPKKDVNLLLYDPDILLTKDVILVQFNTIISL